VVADLHRHHVLIVQQKGMLEYLMEYIVFIVGENFMLVAVVLIAPQKNMQWRKFIYYGFIEGVKIAVDM